MHNLTYPELFEYIGDKIIKPFYELRLARLDELKLNDVLKRKNPYLFKAKNITTAQDLVTEILNAHISSQEETVFGNYLEELAIFICSKEYGGFKSSTPGIDLEMEKDGARYIIAIKSGPNWGNSDQIAKMKLNFIRAIRVLHQNPALTNVIAVNGCCYGKDSHPDKGDYLKLCGQAFWSFISGDDDLYLQIIEPLGKEAKEKDDAFKEAYSRKVNILTAQFLAEFCSDGNIDWNSLLKFVSSKQTP
jgi:Type II restriction endonuclease EcoO109I